MNFRTEEHLLSYGGRLLYSKVEYAFSTEPRPEGCTASVSINELELMLDEDDGRVVFVTGYCPHTGWQTTVLTPPPSRQGWLYAEFDKDLVPGTSISVHAQSERWPVLMDPTNGWIRLGKGNPQDDRDGLEFAPGAIAVLKDGKLVAIWLRPEKIN